LQFVDGGFRARFPICATSVFLVVLFDFRAASGCSGINGSGAAGTAICEEDGCAGINSSFSPVAAVPAAAAACCCARPIETI
jgi:hypothetical protein